MATMKKRDRERIEKQLTNFRNRVNTTETIQDLVHVDLVISEAKEIIEEKASDSKEPKKIEYFPFNEKYIKRYHKAKKPIE